MLRLLADENFDGRILRALQRQIPDLDVLRVQDTPLYGAEDPELLEWAAKENRILLTHDIATLVGFAYERTRSDLPMSGVVAVRAESSLGRAIEDLALILLAAEESDFSSRVLFLPFS